MRALSDDGGDASPDGLDGEGDPSSGRVTQPAEWLHAMQLAGVQPDLVCYNKVRCST